MFFNIFWFKKSSGKSNEKHNFLNENITFFNEKSRLATIFEKIFLILVT